MYKLADQLATLVVVILVTLFCTSGMTSFYRSQHPTETTPPPSQPTQPATISNLPETVPPTKPPQVQWPVAAPSGYFDDALFVGDSRTVGLKEYGNLPGATFFASSGMSVYNIFQEKVGGKTLQDLIGSNKFGKIYVMLGINELGHDRVEAVAKYADLIRWFQYYQPGAIVYVEANLHVSEKRSKTDKTYNNKNLDDFNAQISVLADNRSVFYLDVNPLFDDAKGNLSKDFTADETHVLGKYYLQWTEWIAENVAVVTV